MASLWDWLRLDPRLRGQLRMEDGLVDDQAMGVPMDLVVLLGGTSVVVAPALARAVVTWLVQRRSDVTIKVTGPDGRQISVSGRRIRDAEQLLRTVLESTEAKPADSDE